MESRFLSPSQIEKVLGLSRPSVYRLLKAKKIPSVRLGSRVLIPSSFLDDLTAQALASSADPVQEAK